MWEKGCCLAGRAYHPQGNCFILVQPHVRYAHLAPNKTHPKSLVGRVCRQMYRFVEGRTYPRRGGFTQTGLRRLNLTTPPSLQSFTLPGQGSGRYPNIRAPFPASLARLSRSGPLLLAASALALPAGAWLAVDRDGGLGRLANKSAPVHKAIVDRVSGLSRG